MKKSGFGLIELSLILIVVGLLITVIKVGAMMTGNRSNEDKCLYSNVERRVQCKEAILREKELDEKLRHP